MVDPIRTVREALELARPEAHEESTWGRMEAGVIAQAKLNLARVEAVVKAAREYRSTNPTVKGAAALDAALTALDPTEAPNG